MTNDPAIPVPPVPDVLKAMLAGDDATVRAWLAHPYIGSGNMMDAVAIYFADRATALKAEIAVAREACPIVRRQDYSDAPLLTLIEQEVSQLFQMQSRAEKAEARATALEQELEHLKQRQQVGTCAKCGLTVRDFDGIIEDERGMLHLACSLLGRLAACVQERDDLKVALQDARDLYEANHG